MSHMKVKTPFGRISAITFTTLESCVSCFDVCTFMFVQVSFLCSSVIVYITRERSLSRVTPSMIYQITFKRCLEFTQFTFVYPGLKKFSSNHSRISYVFSGLELYEHYSYIWSSCNFWYSYVSENDQ